MSRLATRKETQLQQETLDALLGVRQQGKLADIYLQFANSEEALRAYLAMEHSLRLGSLTATEVEAIKLWVSQQTDCEFCLSVHTLKAKAAGLNLVLQTNIRRGEDTGDQRLDMIMTLVRTLFEWPGKLDDELLAEARRIGLTDQNLVDITMAMATIFFTNITNHINDSRSSLPAAPALSTSSAGPLTIVE